MVSETSPAGGIREYPAPESTPYDGEEHVSVHYNIARTHGTYSIAVPKSPPEELLLSVEAAIENGVFYMRAAEVDVSVEEETPGNALRSLGESIKEWLEYLEEERPALSPELEPQRRYINLLRYEPLTWFKTIRIS